MMRQVRVTYTGNNDDSGGRLALQFLETVPETGRLETRLRGGFFRFTTAMVLDWLYARVLPGPKSTPTPEFTQTDARRIVQYLEQRTVAPLTYSENLAFKALKRFANQPTQ